MHYQHSQANGVVSVALLWYVMKHQLIIWCPTFRYGCCMLHWFYFCVPNNKLDIFTDLLQNETPCNRY